MSMDLEVWSARPFDLSAWLPNREEWQQFGKEWCFEGEGWQVLVLPADSDNVPVSVRAKLPSAAYVAYVTLEPIGAGPDGYDLLENVVRGLARSSSGLWVDPNKQAFGPDEGAF